MRQVLYILGDLNQSDISWLAETGDIKQPAQGDLIVSAGDAVGFLHIVLDGKLTVETGAGGVLATLAVGDIIGEMSLIEKRKPDVSVIAQASARLLSIPMPVIEQKLKDDEGFAARFYRALAILLSDRLRRANAKLYKNKDEIEGDAVSSENGAGEIDDVELDEGVLDNLHVAGDKMRTLLAMLEGRNV